MTKELQEAIRQYKASPAAKVWDELEKLGFRPFAQSDTWTRNLLHKFDGDVNAVVDYMQNRMIG